MKLFIKIFISIFIISAAQSLFGQDNNDVNNNKNLILSKWQLKSTVLENTSGEEISTGHYTQSNWYPVEVPTTVLNGLVKNGVYPNPRLDMNNYLIPDISDKFNAEHDLAKYSYLPNHVNPWKNPYWFRTEFNIPNSDKGKQVWLNFDGINYRAEVWLNGKMIADSSQMVGMFLRFKYNVTGKIKGDGTNYLAVKIYPVDHPGIPGTQMKVFGNRRKFAEDLFKDETLKISGGWDCALPVRDRNMGIYQDVYLSFTGDVNIINPYIVTNLPLPDTTEANLSISATLFNTSNIKQSGVLKGKIDLLTELNMGDYIKKFPGKMQSITFEKQVEIPANGTVTVLLSYKDFPQLTIKNPHLWWPNGYGEQYLHNLQLSFDQNGIVSETKNTMFGIREVTSKLNKLNGHYGRVFYINGQRVFCKGGWIQPDMLLDMNKKRVYDEVRLMANANMNLVSSEDMPTPPEDLMGACDKYGIMWWEVFYQSGVIVPGTNTAYNPLDHYLAIRSTNDIILRYRNHPCIVAWCGANETLPGPDLYLAIKDQLSKLDTTRTFLASTAIGWNWKKITPYIKDDLPVGTTDNGLPDYAWYPLPFYFNMINSVKNQMFHNELGMDAVPTLSSLKKFIFNLGSDTANPLFPLDSVWAEHGAWDGDNYAFKAYYYAIRNYYGFKDKSLTDFVNTAQLVNADNYRAMFEAANSRMWDITSGVMIWKLNASYPDFAWEMYDWFLNPNAGYFYVKNACEPLHIQMNANDYEVSVINTYHRPINNLTVRVRLYDFNLKVRWEREMKINMGSDRYQEVFSVPQLSEITPIYFVRLELLDNAGKILSSNLYWESSKNPSGFYNISNLSEIGKAELYWDSLATHPVFSDLSKLEKVKLDLSYKIEDKGGEYWVHVKVKNPTKELSIMNRLAIIKKDDNEEVLPTFWDDNFINLFPGEERTLEAKFAKKDLNGSKFSVVVDNNR
ncbi:MAG: beta-mannosidase [Ignavibacteriaceae bacterium]